MSTRAHQLPPEQICRTVLKQVNRALSSAGMCTRQQLPMGKILDPFDCPIHEALRPLGASMKVLPHAIVTDQSTAQLLARCWGTTARPSKQACEQGRWRTTTPGHMRQFINCFDKRTPGYDQFDRDLELALTAV